MRNDQRCCSLFEAESDEGISIVLLACRGRYNGEDRMIVFTSIEGEKVVLILPPVPTTYCVLPRSSRLQALVRALRNIFHLPYSVACIVSSQLIRETVNATLREIINAGVLDEACYPR